MKENKLTDFKDLDEFKAKCGINDDDTAVKESSPDNKFYTKKLYYKFAKFERDLISME